MSYSPVIRSSAAPAARSSPSSKAQAASHQPAVSLSKSHKLEGDGLITGFYDFMLLRNNESMKPCVNIPIPDTVVYTNNFPRGWYYHDTEKSREVMKRQGTDLDSSKVYEFFSQEPSKSVGIVASYMSVYEEDDVITTSVEFFNKSTIKSFVERKNKAEGILQKFIIPKGGTRNTVIQAVWSPNPNAFFVWRRTNRMQLNQKSQWEKDPYPMCVTYDGPSHFSEESTCAVEIKKAIRAKCELIVKHFYQVYDREKIITRLVLYFKLDDEFDGIDEKGKPIPRLWLLWCGGLRVTDANSTQADPTKGSVPLNLAPRYTDSSIEAQRESHEMLMLGETNRKFRELRKSVASGHSKNSPTKGGALEGSGGGNGATTAAGNNPNSPHGAGDHHDADAAQPSAAGGNKSAANASAAAAAAAAATNSNNNNGGAPAAADKEAWHTNPQIHDNYVELCKQRDTVINYLDDIFYEAYGHFLRYDPGPFAFEVDKKIAAMLGNDQLGEAMASGGVGKATPNEAGMGAIDDEDLYFEIQPKHPNGPVSKIGDAVKKWVREYYEKSIQDLKEEAASILPPISSMTGGAATSGNAAGNPTGAARGTTPAVSSFAPAPAAAAAPARVGDEEL